MGKCREITQKIGRQSFSLSSGIAIQITSKDSKQGSIVTVRRKDGKAFNQKEREEIQQFLQSKMSVLRSVFEDWPLWQNKITFSRQWFDGMEHLALVALHAGTILDVRTHKPVKAKARQIQNKIAQAILQRVQLVKALKRKNHSVDRLGSDVLQLWWRLLTEPDRIRGRNLAQAQSQGGIAKGQNNFTVKEWCRQQAKEHWKRRNLSIRSVTQLILNHWKEKARPEWEHSEKKKLPRKPSAIG
jgi:hypothetical protein